MGEITAGLGRSDRNKGGPGLPEQGRLCAGGSAQGGVRRVIPTALAGICLGTFAGLMLTVVIAVQFLGYRILTVQSGSMEPALMRGDIILTRPVPIADLERDDIILFEDGVQTRILVAHRVAGVVNVTTNVVNSSSGEESSYKTRILRTKGDANPLADPGVVDATRLRGELFLTIPGAGYVLERIPIQRVLLGIAALAAAAWCIGEVRVRWKRPASA